MIDTVSKNSRSTLDIFSADTLKYFVKSCKKSGKFCGISGSLRSVKFEDVLSLQPDFIGLRGQLCASKLGRDKLDVKQVSNVLDEFNYALNKSNNGRTLSKVSLYSNSTSES